MKKTGIFLISIIFLSACSCSSNKKSLSISPMQAIEKSAELAPLTIEGVFELTVKSTDSKHRLEFLNSELENQDQRNLIIALRPNAIKELTEMFGDKPQDFFIGKKIKVTGEAKRIKNWVLYKNKKTRDYYYQTKVFVRSADQLTIL